MDILRVTQLRLTNVVAARVLAALAVFRAVRVIQLAFVAGR